MKLLIILFIVNTMAFAEVTIVNTIDNIGQAIYPADGWDEDVATDEENAYIKITQYCNGRYYVFGKEMKSFQGERIPPHEVKGPINIVKRIENGLCKEVSPTDGATKAEFIDWSTQFVFIIRTYHYISFECK